MCQNQKGAIVSRHVQRAGGSEGKLSSVENANRMYTGMYRIYTSQLAKISLQEL